MTFAQWLEKQPGHAGLDALLDAINAAPLPLPPVGCFYRPWPGAEWMEMWPWVFELGRAMGVEGTYVRRDE